MLWTEGELKIQIISRAVIMYQLYQEWWFRLTMLNFYKSGNYIYAFGFNSLVIQKKILY